MKAKIFIILFILLLSPSLYSNLEIINFNKIEGVKHLKSLLAFIMKHEEYLKNPLPDEHWKYEVTKGELKRKLKNVYNKLEKIKEQNNQNQEYYLLKGIIAHYLFNLLEEDYYGIAVNNFQIIDTLENKDFRNKWMLGVHYSRSAQAFKAIAEFKYLEDTISHENLPALFWADFSFASFFAIMPVHAMTYYHKASHIGKENLIHNVYKNIKDQFMQPDFDSQIDSREIYTVLRREDSIGVLSRLYGIWVPIKETWQFKPTNYDGNGSLFFVVPEPAKDKNGQEITFTILVLFSVNNTENFDDFVENTIKSNPHIIQIKNVETTYDCMIYEYNDPEHEQYKHMGGAHGYYVFIKRKEPELPGYSIEKPSMFYFSEDQGEGYRYLALNKEYTRFKGDIYYLFLLDSCNNIFQESQQVFIEFMSDILLD